MGTNGQAMHTLRRAMAAGAHLGDLVWHETAGVETTLRSDVRARLTTAGLPESLCPEAVSPGAALTKACGEYRERGSGLFLRRDDERMVIVRQAKGGGTFPSGTSFAPVAGFAVDEDDGSFIEQPQAVDADVSRVVAQIESAYRRHVDYTDAAEINRMVVAALLGWCGGVRLKRQGHVYWVPAAGHEQVTRLASVLNTLGSSHLTVVEVHDSEANRYEMSGEIAASFGEELAKVQRELAKLADRENVRASTLEARIAEYEEIRNKVDLYADLLSDRRAQLLDGLTAATAAVRKMISDIDAADAATV